MPAKKDPSFPLRPNQLGQALCFEWSAEAYGSVAAKACLHAFRTVRFSGRCEYYARDAPLYGPRAPRLYIVGLGLRSSGPKIDFPWWQRFFQAVADGCREVGGVRLVEENCEYAEVAELRSEFLPRGVVEFKDGLPVRVIEEADSWFFMEVKSRLPPPRSGEVGNEDG